MEAQISVIVPVYKTQAFLEGCVDSVLRQSFRDWELILVDDGSPDDCPALCDGWAARDSRIHVIHQENRGLSAARNAALDWMEEHSASGWLTFLDSDDRLHPKTLEALLRAVREHDLPLAVCRYGETSGPDPEVPELLPPSEVWDGEKFYEENYGYATIACGKLYSRACFASHRFPEGRIHEDEFLTYRILSEQGRLAYIPAPLYFYYINPEGITKSGWSPRRMDALEAFRQQVEFFTGRGNEPLARACLHRYLRAAYAQLLALRQQGGGYPREEQILRRLARQLVGQCHRRGCLNFETDFGVLMEFYPVRTTLHMYYLAALRRLGRNRK